MSAPETTDALAERVLLGLPRLSSTPTVAEQDDAHAALTTLADRVKELEQRLTAYETPGWINSVQKVLEERRRAERAEAEVLRLTKRLDAVMSMLTAEKPPEEVLAYARALSEELRA